MNSNEARAEAVSNIHILKPFKDEDCIQGIGLKCSVELLVDSLLFTFSLKFPEGSVVVPDTSKSPVKNDHLWKNTCFELFISESGKTSYFEFNFSPSHDWNFTAFRDYREPYEKQRERDIARMAKWSKTDEELTLKATLPLSMFSQISTEKLDIGIAAVLEHTDEKLSYWALAHNTPKPNFHNRDSFCLSLA